MGVGEPLGAVVVEVGEGALLELRGGGLVARDGAPGVAGDGFVNPLRPIRAG